jgi:hypothetical protein
MRKDLKLMSFRPQVNHYLNICLKKIENIIDKQIIGLQSNFSNNNLIIKASYFESGYLERGFHALNIQNCDSMSDFLDFLSPEMDQNYLKARIFIIAIKRFILLYNVDIRQIDLNLTYIQKNLFQALLNKTN